MTGRTDSELDFAGLLKRLPSAQKSAKGAPAYSRFINRRAGGYLAVIAYRLGLTPNQVTIVSAICTGIGIALIAILPPSVGEGVGICLALVVGYALDAADGQLARLRGGGSVSGEWLDHVIDSAKIASLHLAVLIAGYRYFHLPAGWLLVPLGYSAVATVSFFAMTLNDQLRRNSGKATRPATRPSTVRSLLVIPTDYGLFCLVFLLWGVRDVYAVVYGLLFVANAAFLALALRKWFGDMRALEDR
ncbi:MAG TPA: CDP-alcohol phosphatidyltransferase family protein [Pseudonocardiaceae bacterium]